MRPRLALLAAASTLALPTLAGTLTAAHATPVAPGSFSSPNVEWLGNIPDAAGISAKFITDGGKAKWMYLSTSKGLTIYDVSNPELPLPAGSLPLPNFENEDIDGNDKLAVISTSPGGDVYVIDTTNKNLPTLAAHLTTNDGDAHTSNCIDACDRWLYSTEGSYLKAIDLQQALAGGSDAQVIHRINFDDYVGAVHDVDQDATGIVWMTGGNGGAGYAVHPLTTGVSAALRQRTRNASPLNPVNVTNMIVNGKNWGRDKSVNDFILHNSKRPSRATYRQTPGASQIEQGGVFLTTEEDYLGDTGGGAAECSGAGRFHTWDATGSTATGAPLRKLDTFTLSEGTLDPIKGDRQVATPFCGAHWFTVQDNIVAIGMYDAGTRFLDVSDPRKIRQVGFFFSADQETWASYWVPGSNIAYSVDLERGLDILQYKGTPPAGTVYRAPAPVRTKPTFLRPSPTLGYACPLVVRAAAAVRR
ncbi:MAG: LVIVD repeat-containing protein [Mycobacteriales bacterium]|nr:hypothetical protein [Frankia sp.]